MDECQPLPVLRLHCHLAGCGPRGRAPWLGRFMEHRSQVGHRLRTLLLEPGALRAVRRGASGLQRAVTAGLACGAGRAELALGSPARATWLAAVRGKAAAKAARRSVGQRDGGALSGSGAQGGGDEDEEENQHENTTLLAYLKRDTSSSYEYI